MSRPKLERAAKQKQGSYRILRPKRSKQELSITASIKPNTKPGQMARDKGKGPASQLKTIKKQGILCDCSNTPPDADQDYFVCSRCLNLQDSACAMTDNGTNNTSTSPLCNNCRASELHNRFAAQKNMIDDMRRLISRKRVEAQNFYAETLWKHYCNLPNGCASDGVVAVTQTRYYRGVMVPTFPAPETWVNKVHGRVVKMIRDAGGAKANEILGHNAMAISHGLGDLVHWRQLAQWLLHRGPYKGRTSELGILAEVLGLEEKGTFWDGDWMESFLAVT